MTAKSLVLDLEPMSEESRTYRQNASLRALGSRLFEGIKKVVPNAGVIFNDGHYVGN
jgi:hypothetical protein